MKNHLKSLEQQLLVTQIVSGFISNNEMESTDVPSFIQLIDKCLKCLKSLNPNMSHINSRSPKPAVPIEESIQPDYIVCLEDGRRMKLLKRHLTTAHNMTPDQYRDRWNLPANYRMVAPNYAKKRTAIAKDIRLGTLRKKAV